MYNLEEEGVWVQKEKIVVPEVGIMTLAYVRETVWHRLQERMVWLLLALRPIKWRGILIERIVNTHIMDPAIEQLRLCLFFGVDILL